jgi:hypothetical protein
MHHSYEQRATSCIVAGMPTQGEHTLLLLLLLLLCHRHALASLRPR